MHIAYFGEPGSYTHEAASQYKARSGQPTDDLQPFPTIVATLDALEVGCDCAVVPYFNTTAGDVDDFVAAYNEQRHIVLDEVILPINHCLLTRKPASAEDIRMIVSHPQALKQCAYYLQAHLPQASLHEAGSTSDAAKHLSEGAYGPDTAVIASQKSAILYKLTVLAKDIQDNMDNKTHFYVICKNV